MWDAMSELQYRIGARAIKTGKHLGYGTGKFPFAEAKHYADEMNRDDGVFVHHWPELANTTEDDQEG